MTRILAAAAFAAAALAAAAGTSTASAQGTDLSGYWDALTAAPTLTAALSIPRPDSAAGGDPELIDGMLQLRTYELTLDRTEAMVGQRQLERVVERRPNDPWARFALGALLSRGPDVRERAYSERRAYIAQKNSNAAMRAPRELRRALELDPGMHAAAIELGRLALDLRDRALMREAEKLLTSERHRDHAPALMMAAKINMVLHLPLEAADLAAGAKEKGYDHSIADHERAVALLKVKGSEEAGARAYFDGMTAPTRAGVAAYTAALGMLLDSTNAAEWTGLEDARRKEWLQRFWERSAALAGVPLSRRLAAHYERLEQLTNRRFAPILDTSTDSVPTPDGPISRIFGKPSMRTEEAHSTAFIRYGDRTRVQRFMFCAPGWDTLPVPMQPTLAECLASPYGRDRANVQLGALRAQSIERALPGERFYPEYDRHLTMAWEALQFRAVNGGAQVVAAVAVRGASAAALRADDVLQPAVTLTLVDTIADWTRQAQSNAVYDARGVTADTWLLFGLSTAAPAGEDVALRIAVENTDATAGAIVYGEVDVAAFHPDSLTMSDVVISPTDAYGGFQRGAIRVALAPGRTFTAAEEPTVYYEVYGVSPGATVATEIRLSPVRESLLDRMRAVLGRDDGVVSVSFQEPATAPDSPFGLQQTRAIGLSQLLPGEYRLTVIVTDMATGRSTSREKWLQLD